MRTTCSFLALPTNCAVYRGEHNLIRAPHGAPYRSRFSVRQQPSNLNLHPPALLTVHAAIIAGRRGH
jgi:hypothetical protein